MAWNAGNGDSSSRCRRRRSPSPWEPVPCRRVSAPRPAQVTCRREHRHGCRRRRAASPPRADRRRIRGRAGRRSCSPRAGAGLVSRTHRRRKGRVASTQAAPRGPSSPHPACRARSCPAALHARRTRYRSRRRWPQPPRRLTQMSAPGVGSSPRRPHSWPPWTPRLLSRLMPRPKDRRSPLRFRLAAVAVA